MTGAGRKERRPDKKHVLVLRTRRRGRYGMVMVLLTSENAMVVMKTIVLTIFMFSLGNPTENERKRRWTVDGFRKRLCAETKSARKK